MSRDPGRAADRRTPGAGGAGPCAAVRRCPGRAGQRRRRHQPRSQRELPPAGGEANSPGVEVAARLEGEVVIASLVTPRIVARTALQRVGSAGRADRLCRQRAVSCRRSPLRGDPALYGHRFGRSQRP